MDCEMGSARQRDHDEICRLNDQITRLTRERDRLREALKKIADCECPTIGYISPDGHKRYCHSCSARAALAGEEGK